MKFDFVIGNPPYQEETAQASSSNGQKPRKNIFQHFQIGAEQIATEGTVLVYPGGRWIHQSGKGLKQFGLEQINDKRLSKVAFYPNAKELFRNTDIPDGVTIVVKNQNKNTEGFDYCYSVNGETSVVKASNPGNELMPLNPRDVAIIEKINEFVQKNELAYLHDSILSRSLFAIESDYVEKNASIVRDYVEGDTIDEETEIKIFTNDKAGSAGRSRWFVAPRNIITQNEKYVYEWQVVVSSAHAGGQDGRDSQMAIIDNHSAFGRARVALKSFITKREAENFYKYAKSKLIRYAFLMTDEALSSLAKRVPDIIDYSDKGVLIDYAGDIDSQMYQLIGLSDEEVKYIETVVGGV